MTTKQSTLTPTKMRFLAGFLLVAAVGCNGGKNPTRSTNDAAPDSENSADGASDSGSDDGGGGEIGASSDADSGDGAVSDGATSDGAVATPPPDFIWYVLDETTGAMAKDSSSHHYDITNLTGVTWSQGAVFDGVSCGGSVAVDPSYRVPPVTITAWLTPHARADETANQYVLVPYPTNAIGDDLPGSFGYGVGLNVWTDGNGGSALSAEDLDTCHGPINGTVTCDIKGAQPDGGADFVADREYFVSVTVGASLASAIYVDGAPFQTTTAAPLATSTATTLYLGRHNDDTGYASKRFFAGKMRDVRVYKRELSAAEVAQLYANGPTTTAPARQ